MTTNLMTIDKITVGKLSIDKLTLLKINLFTMTVVKIGILNYCLQLSIHRMTGDKMIR